MRMMKLRLRVKLLIGFLVVILLSLSTVGIAFYTISARQLSQSAENQMTQIVNNAVHHTNLYLSSYQRSMVALLSNLNVKKYIDLPSDREEYENYRYLTDIRDSIVGKSGSTIRRSARCTSSATTAMRCIISTGAPNRSSARKIRPNKSITSRNIRTRPGA